MKNHLLLLAAAATFTFASCGKDDKKDDPKPADPVLTKTDHITSKSWKLTDRTQAANGSTFNTYGNVQTCKKDDLLKFAKDLKVTFDAGAQKCYSSDPQTEAGSWAFLSSETKLKIVDANNNTEEYDLAELTATKMVVKQTEVFSWPGMPTTTYIYTYTYTAQ